MRIRTTGSDTSLVVTLLGVALAAPGCASKLQLSPAATELRSHLSDTQARMIVESALQRDERGKGGAMEAHWNLNVGPTYPIDIKVVDRAVEYLSPGREHAKGEELDKQVHSGSRPFGLPVQLVVRRPTGDHCVPWAHAPRCRADHAARASEHRRHGRRQ